MDLSAQAALNMSLEGVTIGLDVSPTNLHGLTHRELGDYTDTLAVLMETPNPAHGRLHGKIDSELVVTGQDEYYELAAEYGRLYVPFDESGWPLSVRVARHVTGVLQFANAYNELGYGSIVLEGIPSYSELAADIGPYLIPQN